MITKKQSKMIQGIAIMLMMYHHFFSYPDTNLYTFINIDFTQKAAWYAKLCVALFSFVSGYGMCIAFIKVREKCGKNLLVDEYKNVFVRLLRLFSQYWIIVLLNIFICVVFLKETVTFQEFLGNAFLTTLSFNGSWWFMRQYLCFMLIAPVIDYLINGLTKKDKNRMISILVIAGVIGVFVLTKLFFPQMEGFYDLIQPTFITVFVVGFVCKRFSFFEKADNVIPDNKLIQIAMGIILIAMTAVIRVTLAKEPSYAKADVLLAPVFSLGAILVFRNFKIISKIFETLGTYAGIMWLIHLMVHGRSLNMVLKITRNSFLFYLIEVLLTFIFAWILQNIFELVAKLFRKQKI